MAPRSYITSVSISAAEETVLRIGIPRPLLSRTSPGEFAEDGDDVSSACISGGSRVFFHDGRPDGKEVDGGREGKATPEVGLYRCHESRQSYLYLYFMFILSYLI